MKHWLVTEGTFKPEQIHVSRNPRIWTSWGEIRETISMIEQYDLPRNVLVVSTWNHVYPRLWLTWRILLLFKKGWHVRFCSTWKCRVGMMHELLGTAKYAFMAMRTRFRRYT